MHKYQSLMAWKRAHELALSVLDATDRVYQPQARAVFDQLRRADVSVEANIVEGYALGTSPQFRRDLRIAIGSAAELECMARLAAERGYWPAGDVARISRLADDTIGLLIGLWRKPAPLQMRRPSQSVTHHSSDGTAPGSLQE